MKTTFREDQQTEGNDIDMLDQPIERTPAFYRETAEELENKLFKKIKIGNCDKYRNQDNKSELKKSRLEQLNMPKEKHHKDKIDKLYMMIK